MSMLAEKRRKTKYVINPTRKPLWTTDSSGIKFGKELMEKMGWSAGKGLGANEQGIQEPLRVSFKNDSKGMGFKGNEEKWVEYQDEFNCLLNQLASNSDIKVKAKETEKSEVISLEEKSKHSKARVHYQKFTRGKDLSKYSEKDLSCILGTSKKKKEKDEKATEQETLSNSNNTCETSFGVTTINSGSYKDYFKKKWTNNNLNCENSSPEECLTGFNEHQINEKIDEVEAKKPNKRHKVVREECLGDENGIENTGNVGKEIKKHKKKRKNFGIEEEIPSKKEKEIDLCEKDKLGQKIEDSQSEVNGLPPGFLDDCIEDVHAKKKKKKRKKRDFEAVRVEECTEPTGESVDEEKSVKKKKKKKERQFEEMKVVECMEQTEASGDEENTVKKKKNKMCLKESEKKENLNEEFSGVILIKNKKDKKDKEYAEAQCQPEEIRKKAKKHKKKGREKETENEDDRGEGKTLEDQEVSEKKKDQAKSETLLESGCSSETSGGNVKGADRKDESKESLIHTHKTALFQMKKPIIDDFKKCSTSKALKLICGAEIEKFRGSNLGKIPGYGNGEKTNGEIR